MQVSKSQANRSPAEGIDAKRTNYQGSWWSHQRHQQSETKVVAQIGEAIWIVLEWKVCHVGQEGGGW